jgi:hypothetical protein
MGPGIGTCGPAARFGQFTVSTDLRCDPNWESIHPLSAIKIDRSFVSGIAD